jgi:sigma-B regulation protein RsbU (phosphoserine phosphatase)
LLKTLLAAVESAGEAIIVADLEGDIVYVNPAFERITQYPRQEVIGKNPRLLKCDQNDPAIYRDLWATITRGDVWRGSFFNRKKDGSLYHVEQTISPAMDGDGRTVSYVSVHRDITDSQPTQEALRLAAAVESAGDAIVLTDLDGTILYVNAAFERINGAPRAKIIGQNLRQLKGGSEELVSPEGRRLWDTLAHGETWRGAFRSQRTTGGVYWIEKTIAPVRNAAGAVIGYVSVGRDVTQHYARQAAERNLAAAHREMDAAKSIQQKLFPQESPSLPGFDIAGRTYPADHLCGDYFDFVPMDGGSLGVAVGDVSGHGLAAALLMVDARAYLRGLATLVDNLGEILSRANSLLAHDIESIGFVTLLFARFDPARQSLVHAGAGHEAYLLRRDGTRATLESTGLPLGILEHEIIPCAAEISLDPGDVVLLATDGLTETPSPADELFGVARALDVIRAHRDSPAEAIVEALYAAARDFSRDQPQHDDMTIVVVKRCE